MVIFVKQHFWHKNINKRYQFL